MSHCGFYLHFPDVLISFRVSVKGNTLTKQLEAERASSWFHHGREAKAT